VKSDPFWIVQTAFSKVHFRQDKYSSFAVWIHGAHKIRHVTALSVQRTVCTVLMMSLNWE